MDFEQGAIERVEMNYKPSGGTREELSDEAENTKRRMAAWTAPGINPLGAGLIEAVTRGIAKAAG